MTPKRWQEIKEVFLGALELGPGGRPDFLARTCAGDPELQRQVETLLADHELADSFIEHPAIETGSPWPGRRLGAYRILEEIEEGGMGAVYRAQRADSQYDQKVAVKVIRRGMASERIVARFRQERQILAKLDHPWIARLLDGGTTPEGQPFLVMEYIVGEPIDSYCDHRRYSIGQRLELFRKVCDAVHYAHQNLVIHRDVKPSNILVTAAGEPKLLDFGTAKLLGPDLAEPGLASTLNGPRLMTPEYASPEQLRGESITTASDVYALGVVLYELLTGRRPFRFANRYSPEVLRIVCEQEPERPSTVVERPSADDGGDSSAGTAPRALAALRREAPGKLRRRLEGDLDNIALMALRKEPGRRYSSVGQLSEDLRRHLAGLPVAARKDTWSYHFGKFVRRHRLAVAAGVLAFVAVVAGAVTALWQAQEAQRERARAEQVAELLRDLFRGSQPDRARGMEITARELLEQAESRIRSELRDQPELRATLMDEIGVVYHDIGLYERAAPLLKEALELRRGEGERSPDVATSWSHLGQLELDRGRYDAAERFLENSLGLRRALLGKRHPAVAASLDDLGRLRYARGDFAGAALLHRGALEMRRERLGNDSREVAESLNNLAADLQGAGRLEESMPLMEEALAIRRKLFGTRHPDTLASLNNIATLLYVQAFYDRAEPMARQCLKIARELYGDENASLAVILDLLAALRHKQGELEEAGELYHEALELRRELLEPDHPDIAYSLNNLAVLMQDVERYEEAEELYREALALRREILGGGHPDVAHSLENLAHLLERLQRYEEAEELYREALVLRRKALGPDHPDVARSLEKLADLR